MDRFEEIFDRIYDDIRELAIHNNLLGSTAIGAFALNNVILVLAFTSLRNLLVKYSYGITISELVFIVIAFASFAYFYKQKRKLTWPQIIGIATRQTIIFFLTSFTLVFIIFFLIYYFIVRRKMDNANLS